MKCPQCGSANVHLAVTTWTAQANEDADNVEDDLPEHQCQDCSLSFWCGVDMASIEGETTVINMPYYGVQFMLRWNATRATREVGWTYNRMETFDGTEVGDSIHEILALLGEMARRGVDITATEIVEAMKERLDVAASYSPDL